MPINLTITQDQIDEVFVWELRHHGALVRSLIAALRNRRGIVDRKDMQHYKKIYAAIETLLNYYCSNLPENARWGECKPANAKSKRKRAKPTAAKKAKRRV